MELVWRELEESAELDPQPYDLSKEEEQHFLNLSEHDDLASDIVWAYHHLQDTNVKATDAPSRGAWFLLLDVREWDDYKAFYKDMVMAAMKVLHQRRMKAEDESGEYVASATERKQTAEIESLFQAALKESKSLAKRKG